MRRSVGLLERNAAAQRTRTLRVKIAVLAVFGGVCVCCGERRMQLLTIDHLDGDGAAHRRWIAREFGGYSGQSFYRGLLVATRAALLLRGRPFGPWTPAELREARPERFQVLCRNCQAAKGCGAGDCPCRDLETFDEVMAATGEDDLVSSVLASVRRRGRSSAPGGRRWAADDVKELSHWLHDGVPTSEIARRLGRSVPAVIAKADREGLWVPWRG